uniref:Non-haem dioxygenase N-terminal domain-containing protein n=2 Tax=Moniliophthora roreri TaxID=221103 RepID=A0A0W0F2V2_MONRR
MPGLITVPEVPRYILAQPTTEALDYADLPIIDLSKAHSTPGAFQELAGEIRSAMSAQGFLYVINHGYTPSQACRSDDSTERIFDIADVPFTQVSENEKKVYDARAHETGFLDGYKLRQYWHIEGGVRDQLEQYNINKNVSRRDHPEAIRPFLPEVEAFSRHNHFNVVQPILRLLATGLGLSENTFVDMHDFLSNGESHVRLMKYHPRSEDDEIKSQNLWLKGHTGQLTSGTDRISLSLISACHGIASSWSGRQVEIGEAYRKCYWDALDFLSGGYYKATIHRVVQPPADQRNVTRLGIGYFTIPDYHVKLAPLTDSPVLQRVGIQRRFESDENAPTMEEWRKGRSLAYGQSKTVWKSGEQQGEAKVDEEIINGIVLKHYK